MGIAAIRERILAVSHHPNDSGHLIYATQADVVIADYRIQMIPLLEVFERKRYLVLPQKSRHSGTSTAVTKQREDT